MAAAVLPGLTPVFPSLSRSTWLMQAQGYRMYPPRGTFVHISFPSGETRRVHVWCTGPAASPERPAFFFDVGGGGHSMSDMWGVQFGLNAAGRRVCTYDPPGTAWSDYPVATNNQDVTGLVIAQLKASLGEPGPFILLGDMDGGPDRIYEVGGGGRLALRSAAPAPHPRPCSLRSRTQRTSSR